MGFDRRFEPTEQKFTLEHRPRTRRYEISTLANLTRHYSLLFTSDLTQDSEVTERRFLAGLTVRF